MTDTIQTFDPDIDVTPSILWQYENASKFVALILSQQAWIEENQNKFWTDWFRDVFDVDTANDFGLSVWSRILNINLYVDAPPTTGNGRWGFGQYRSNFNRAGFGRNSQGVIGLTLEQKRIIIKLRMVQIITRPTAYYINEQLDRVFNTDTKKLYAYDVLDMSDIVYVFNYPPESSIEFILRNFDILPRPSTLGVRWIYSYTQAWGFGQYRLNFNNGNFSGAA